MPAEPPQAAPQQEIDRADRERTDRLLDEIGRSPYYSEFEERLLAYNAVLLKDIRFSLVELLTYKQTEVHR